jgi:hypothetical protein
MGHKRTFTLLIASAVMCLDILAQSSGFFAYHTRLPNPNITAMEDYFREDAQQYRDIIVNIGDRGRFIFAAAESYRPYWQTPRGTFYPDDIIDRELDEECLYSFARILENGTDKIVIHWRYYPILSDITFASPVHEYFEITPGGKVTRRVVEGREKLDEYLDPGNVATEVMQLDPGGLTIESFTPAKLLNEPGQPLEGTAVTARGVARPVLWLNFDDGLETRISRYITVDQVTNNPAAINGGMALWKKGVSGTCLAFDGYHSSVSIPSSDVPEIDNSFSVEAWVALGAYPWNDVPVVHQSIGIPDHESDIKQGYYLGVDTDGRPFFAVGSQRISFGDPLEMESYRWYHLAGTFGEGRIRLYLDGKEVASSRSKGSMVIPDTDLVVGLNSEAYRMRVSEWHRDEEQNMPYVFGVEGLIDEVKLYDRVLTAAEVEGSFHEITSKPSSADLEPRILPGEVDGKPAEKFGAYYTYLEYHDLWDQMWRLSETPDVAVRFDLSPAAVTYWHGQNYAAGWVTENNRWMADQSCEDWGPHGCAEHMSDKQCRHAHIRIIENTPARSVVHWRYRSVDIGYKTCEIEDYCWTDEYHTLYPDGAAVRRVVWNLYGYPSPGWQDIQIFMQPGTSAADHLHIDAMSMANMSGETELLNYSHGDPDVSLDNALIQMVNFKSDHKVFMIAPPGTEPETWSDPFVNRWDHWPVGLYPSDGRDAVALDRVAHAALSASNVHFKGNMAIYGLTDQPVSGLVPLAKSWNTPPRIIGMEGCEDAGYQQSERAYSIIARQHAFSFTLEGSEERVIYNPCFVIRNWNSDELPVLNIDGTEQPVSTDVRLGIKRNTEGRQDLVVWLKKESERPVVFTFSGARPDVEPPSPYTASWEIPPRADESGALTAYMKVFEVTDESSVSYSFECLNDPGISSGWQKNPEYLVNGLSPNREYSFRVRARDTFHNLTEYSELSGMKTGSAPLPMASWKLDNKGTTAVDEYGRYHGEIRGATFVEGKAGMGLKFDKKDFIRIKNAQKLNTEQDFSWTMWIKTTGTGAIIGKTGESEFDDGFKNLYVNEEGYLVFENYFGLIESEMPVNDGTWKHIALTVDVTAGHDVISIYIDGEKSIQRTLNLKVHGADGLPVKVGYFNEESPEDGSSGFRGIMDEIQWYDYVLGPGHVKEIYNLQRTTEE